MKREGFRGCGTVAVYPPRIHHLDSIEKPIATCVNACSRASARGDTRSCLSEVDLEAREALIAWQLQRVAARLLRWETKTASSDATLPLSEICVRVLEGRLELERRFRAQAEAWYESGGRDCGTTVKKIISRGRPEAATPGTSQKRLVADEWMPAIATFVL